MLGRCAGHGSTLQADRLYPCRADLNGPSLDRGGARCGGLIPQPHLQHVPNAAYCRQMRAFDTEETARRGFTAACCVDVDERKGEPLPLVDELVGGCVREDGELYVVGAEALALRRGSRRPSPDRSSSEDRLGQRANGAKECDPEPVLIHLVLDHTLGQQGGAGCQHRAPCGPGGRANLELKALASQGPIDDLERGKRRDPIRAAREAYPQSQAMVLAGIVHADGQSGEPVGRTETGTQIDDDAVEREARQTPIRDFNGQR